MYEDRGKPEGTVWDPRLLPLTIGTMCGTNTPPDVARRLLNIKPSALPCWGEERSGPSLWSGRERRQTESETPLSTWTRGEAGGGCSCMLTCGDASVADGENKDKATDLVDLVSSSNEKYARRSRASSFLFFFPPRAESGPGSSPPPPPFPVRPPRGGRTPRGNGGPQSGFVGQNLVFWIIAFLQNVCVVFNEPLLGIRTTKLPIG